jgi:hypothetical protein
MDGHSMDTHPITGTQHGTPTQTTAWTPTQLGMIGDTVRTAWTPTQSRTHSMDTHPIGDDRLEWHIWTAREFFGSRR